ncbi:PTS sugar transporter subunit IIB [Lacrimispora amygdalina]|uniref:PTS sugar transporter subunit IIB n=1 Tax=Lacrimispora amygdalina TaxID=253257 RepID=A0A3E2N7N3_9FIRM|nr:PTS sugar transporter subunit IIB [Clostridium indicum]RFZ76901.1 PTS sugar transporter subunit IIB [Clostridium indicum]
MIHITLICAAGMSTSMLTQRMQKAAESKNLEVEIIAMPESKFRKYKGETEVLLLGPQVRYLLEEIKAEFQPKGMKVAVIDMKDYGMMNGEKVLEDALKLLG